MAKGLNLEKKYPKMSGISIVELMVALTLGLFVTGVVTAVFVSTSRSFRDLQKSGEQIENGRFAISLLTDQVRHAGFFGQLAVFKSFAGTADPCVTPTADHLYYPVQVYSASLTAKPSQLPSCLADAEIKSGSDILVIRRTDTNALIATDVPVVNVVYLQSNPTVGDIQLGVATAVGIDKKANGQPAVILNKDGTAAPIRRLHVEFYYVSPCSEATCGSSGGDGIPTLKRLEMLTGGGSPTWSTASLVSGIEYMQVDLGIDSTPTTKSDATGLIGDGVADGDFEASNPTAPSTWNDVVALRIHLLSRTLETISGYSDTGKTYVLGTAGNLAGSGGYKRRVYSVETRLNNVSGRRERLVGE